jgi:hypothetical protein
LPETRRPTSSLANQGLILVEIATSSRATLQEGSAEALGLSQKVITPFSFIAWVPRFAFG